MPKSTLPNEVQFQVMEARETLTERPAHVSFLNRLVPKFLHEVRDTFKNEGLKGTVKRFGWKLFAAFFAYYLIRDSIIYLLIPYLIAQKMM